MGTITPHFNHWHDLYLIPHSHNAQSANWSNIYAARSRNWPNACDNYINTQVNASICWRTEPSVKGKFELLVILQGTQLRALVFLLSMRRLKTKCVKNENCSEAWGHFFATITQTNSAVICTEWNYGNCQTKSAFLLHENDIFVCRNSALIFTRVQRRDWWGWSDWAKSLVTVATTIKVTKCIFNNQQKIKWWQRAMLWHRLT